MQCAKCFLYLPEGAQSCPKCGEPAPVLANPAVPPATTKLAPVPVEIPPTPPPRRRRPISATRLLSFVMVLLVIAGIISWIGFSDSWTAGQIRDYVTGARTQAIVETPFTVKPRAFMQYQFAVPAGAVSVNLTGQFESTGSPPASDDTIAVTIITDDAFVAWQNGYSTSTFYDSGKAARGTIGAQLPSHSGIYYVVFSNGFSAAEAKARKTQGTPKNVRANVLLHYKTWLPEWLVGLKNKFPLSGS